MLMWADRGFSMLYGCKDHLYGSKRPGTRSPEAVGNSNPQDVEPLIQRWDRDVPKSLNQKLDSIGLIPYFFVQPPPGSSFQSIDSYRLIHRLRTMTTATVQRRTQGLLDKFQDPRSGQKRDCSVGLLYPLICTHVSSIWEREDSTTPEDDRLKARKFPWSGITTACVLYLHSVLKHWGVGESMDERLHRHLLLILKRDLGACEDGQFDLNLWQTFVGALSLATLTPDAGSHQLHKLSTWFRSRLRALSKIHNIIRWQDARRVLEIIVWPAVHEQETLAEMVWQDATQQ